MAAPEIKLSQQELIQKLDELPTLPSIVYELTQIINDPMSSTAEVETVMQNDVSMTTRVLKLANSAYYAIPGGVTSLRRAIAHIGFDTVSQLVLSSSIIDALDVKADAGFNMNDLWKHSVGTGIAAETIAKHLRHPSPSDLFTAGLVHDLGKVALCTFDMSVFMEITKFAVTNKKTMHEAERTLGVPTHTEIGKLLAEKWQLPMGFNCAIAYHHEPSMSIRSALSAENNRTVDIVTLANLVVHALKFGHSGHERIEGVPTELMARLGMNAEADFIKLARMIKGNLDRASEFIEHLLGGKK